MREMGKIFFQDRRVREEAIASGLSLLLAAGKLMAGLWTGALALFASALDSLMDSFVSGVNLFSLIIAERPADQDHAFGHGKAEAIAALFQSLFIFGSALYLLFSCFRRFQNPVSVGHLGGGMGVVLISLFAGLTLSRRLQRVAVATGSVILKTDSLHYAMDLYTQLGILASFLVIQFTGWNLADPLITLPIAVYVAYLSIRIGRQAIDELMDRELSPEIQETVNRIIQRHHPQVLGMHNFKSRHAGSKRFLQFHLDIKRDMPFEEVHELEERIAGEIRRELGNVQVMIHADPEGHGLDQTDLM